MRTFIFLSVIAASLSGCGYIDRQLSGYTGKPSSVCVDGVTYLQFTSGVSVKYNLDGKPVQCN